MINLQARGPSDGGRGGDQIYLHITVYGGGRGGGIMLIYYTVCVYWKGQEIFKKGTNLNLQREDTELQKHFNSHLQNVHIKNILLYVEGTIIKGKRQKRSYGVEKLILGDQREARLEHWP